jgi:multiple sugar transport system permease protein
MIRRAARSENVTGWLFVLPAVALIGLFGIVPIIWGAILSLQQNDLLTPPTWVGLDNYRTLIHDPVFRASVHRTFVYTLLFVPISVGGALAIAVLLNRRIRFSRFYRTAVFIPVATSTVATGIIFNWLLEPTYGVANYLLGQIGLGPYGYFQDPDQAMYSIVAMTVWGWIGFDVIVYLAALQGVPGDLPQRRLPPAVPDHPVPRRLVDDQRPAGVRRDLRDDARRPAAGDDRDGLLPLQPGVRAVPRRLCGGHRLRAVPDDARAVGRPAVGRQPEGALQLMRLRLPFNPWHLVLVPLSVLMLVPLAWMLITSFQTLSESRHFPPHLLPSGIHWENYPDAWNAAPFGRFFINSLTVTLASVAGNLLFCSLAGYAFARLRFFGRDVLFVVLLATLMVPFQVTMIPTFLIVKHLGLVNSLGALIAPNLVTPFGIFLLRQFFRTIPIELEEAARMDGCSRLGVLVRIIIPLSMPALATLGIVIFLWTWNDFLWPLIVIASPNESTVQLGLASFQGAHQTNWPLLMAGNVMALAPMLIVFIVAQRYFVQSLASTGLKG